MENVETDDEFVNEIYKSQLDMVRAMFYFTFSYNRAYKALMDKLNDMIREDGFDPNDDEYFLKLLEEAGYEFQSTEQIEEG